MLHIIIEETRDVHNYDSKINNNPFDDAVICFGSVDSIQKKFCSEFEQMYLYDENLLKTDLIIRYLKELWNIDWYDNYTFLLHENGKDVRVTPTYLSCDLQLSMLMLSCAEKGLKARLTEFIPYMENLALISKNCEMTIYVNTTVVQDFIFGNSKRTRAAENEEGIFDLVWKSEHYSGSWSSFWFDVLRKHFNDLGYLNKEVEQYYFNKYLKSKLARDTEVYSLKEFLEKYEPEIVKEESVLPNVTVEFHGSEFRSAYQFYNLFILLKKDDTVYLYTNNDASFDYPTLYELLLYRCLHVSHSIKEFSLTGQSDECGNENLAEWADEVILFITNQQNYQSIIELYKDYGSCMLYEREKRLVHILKEEQGIPLFHELYQKAIPWNTLDLLK